MNLKEAKHIVYRMNEFARSHIGYEPNVVFETPPMIHYEKPARGRLHITGTLFSIRCKTSNDDDIQSAMDCYVQLLQELESMIFDMATSYYGCQNVNITQVFDPLSDIGSDGNCYVRIKYSID